jgi:hypothetical protein
MKDLRDSAEFFRLYKLIQFSPLGATGRRCSARHVSLLAILVIGSRHSSPHESVQQLDPSAMVVVALTVRVFFSGTLSIFTALRL